MLTNDKPTGDLLHNMVRIYNLIILHMYRHIITVSLKLITKITKENSLFLNQNKRIYYYSVYTNHVDNVDVLISTITNVDYFIILTKIFISLTPNFSWHILIFLAILLILRII